ncbi:hypothetical protein VF21_07975 [Pseudogymnoascus sp. 05NY08]|nr:hypothetical protein VF21_07975 [Pseudogymnoascus sp. 05NY08]
MGYMTRVARGPALTIDILLMIINPDELDLYCAESLFNCEKISRFFASWSARLDLATVYKNYIGLDYPDAKDVSIYFGCPERARELDPQEEEEIKTEGFRPVIDQWHLMMFRSHLRSVCNAELFDDHVVRMTTDVPLMMAHHVTYLGMAMLQCGLTLRQGQDAMEMCWELRDALKEIVLGLPLAGRIVRLPDVTSCLERCFLYVDEYGTDSGGEGLC